MVSHMFVKGTGKVGKDGIRVPGLSFNFKRIANFLATQPNWYQGTNEGTGSPTSMGKAANDCIEDDMASKTTF